MPSIVKYTGYEAISFCKSKSKSDQGEQYSILNECEYQTEGNIIIQTWFKALNDLQHILICEKVGAARAILSAM